MGGATVVVVVVVVVVMPLDTYSNSNPVSAIISSVTNNIYISPVVLVSVAVCVVPQHVCHNAVLFESGPFDILINKMVLNNYIFKEQCNCIA